ncbi:hypothetical protein [Leptospira vanthielii]|uniref:Uncharacterized protein n=1 Tax=Leptospira vanthielii serovar Holland str. Waz Holland = ATCC 700522 TaxID=1218591 RepID=N1VV32_9LEPT|nr:hypothetical protein [Leptospira vanthielii]EMY67799.1 hypothetical protein LEP1GSC199_0112 [Leptospira vanthielii serovar Holland str. Waz Holland = ATCC 700522]
MNKDDPYYIDPFTIKALINNLQSRIITHKQELQFRREPIWREVVYSLCRKNFYAEERTRKTYEEKRKQANEYQKNSEAGQWSRVADQLSRKKLINWEQEDLRILQNFGSGKDSKNPKPTSLEVNSEDYKDWSIVCRYLAKKKIT